MPRLTDALAKLNRVGARPLLWADTAIGFFTGLAHGGSLLLARAGKGPPGAAEDLYLTYVTIPAASIVAITGVVALARPSLQRAILKVHSLILVVGAIAALCYGVRVAILGVPSGVQFVWNPVFYALCLAYPAFLLQRAFVRDGVSVNSIAVQLPVWTVGISIVISSVIMWRLDQVDGREEDDASSPQDSLSVPRAQTEPAVPEASWDGVASGDVVTLLSTSFELAPGETGGAAQPFVQNGSLPWSRDARAHSGRTAINVIPHGNPGNLNYFGESISPVLLSAQLSGGYVPFRVEPFRRVQLEFWRLSSSNPSEKHNCLGSLRVDYRLDTGPWQSKMVFCGSPKSRPPEWIHTVLDFSTAGHKELEFRFDYEYPPDSHKDRTAVYLVDDLTVRGYR